MPKIKTSPAELAAMVNNMKLASDSLLGQFQALMDAEPEMFDKLKFTHSDLKTLLLGNYSHRGLTESIDFLVKNNG